LLAWSTAATPASIASPAGGEDGLRLPKSFTNEIIVSNLLGFRQMLDQILYLRNDALENPERRKQ
jgi:hypothetical protein